MYQPVTAYPVCKLCQMLSWRQLINTSKQHLLDIETVTIVV
jgi:hypothetical protein